MKILHFADVHLGRGFSGYAEVSETLREARFETLESLIKIANEESCDAITIAGDLFEQVTMKKAEVERAIQILNGFRHGPVLLLPGNHDYFTSDSNLWRYVEDAKEDHILVLSEKTPLSLENYDLDLKIFPAPCHTRHSSDHEIGWINDEEKNSETVNIGIAHGSVTGVAPDMNDEHYPMTQQELNQAGVDLWLLGHIHVPWPDNPGGQDRILYSGTPEPDTANCPHGGTALMIEIEEADNIQVQKMETGKYRFEKWEKEVSTLGELEQLQRDARADENKQIICRLTISGRLDDEAYTFWLEELLPEIRDAFLYLKLDDEELNRKITKEQIKQEFPEESFPDKLLSTFIEQDKEQALQTAYEFIEEVRDEN